MRDAIVRLEGKALVINLLTRNNLPIYSPTIYCRLSQLNRCGCFSLLLNNNNLLLIPGGILLLQRANSNSTQIK